MWCHQDLKYIVIVQWCNEICVYNKSKNTHAVSVYTAHYAHHKNIWYKKYKV